MQVIKVVNLRSGASQLLAAAEGADAGPLLLANVAAILPAEAAASSGGAVSRVTDLLVLTAVGGWLGGSDGTAPFSWSLLRRVALSLPHTQTQLY